jgi:hypothetical protein
VPRPTSLFSWLLLVGAVALVTGCDAGAGSAPASAVRRFEAALAGQPCPRAILDQDLPATVREPRSVDRYGTSALARLAEDTLFLSRFRDGWRITAAGCTAVRAAPYACTVED